MITDMDIPMLPGFSDDARSVLEGFLERNVRSYYFFIGLYIA